MSNQKKQEVELILGILKDLKVSQELTKINYRPDYQDFQLLFGDTHHCEIQEKTIQDVLELKNEDAKRQIIYWLSHLTPWAEWESPPSDQPRNDDKMVIEDDI